DCGRGGDVHIHNGPVENLVGGHGIVAKFERIAREVVARQPCSEHYGRWTGVLPGGTSRTVGCEYLSGSAVQFGYGIIPDGRRGCCRKGAGNRGASLSHGPSSGYIYTLSLHDALPI